MKFYLLPICLWLSFQATAQFSTIPTQSASLTPYKSYATPDGGKLMLKKISDEQGGRHWKKFRYDLTLFKHDKDMLLTGQKNLGKEKFGALHADLLKSDGRFWVLYFEPVDGTEVGDVKAMAIDPVTLEPGETKRLAEQTTINEKISAFGGFFDKTVVVRSSPNSKFHLLMIDNNDRSFYLSCLNEKLEPVWSSTVDLAPYKQEEITAYEVDDNGVTYVAAVGRTGTQLTYFNERGEATHQQVSPDAVQPTDMQVLPTSGGQVVLSGFYGKKDNSEGAYFATLDKKSGSLENIRQTAFPDSMIQRLKKDGFASTKASKYGIYKWEYRSKLVEQADGNVNLVTELNTRLGNGHIRAKGVGSLLVSHLTTSPKAVFSHIPRYAVSNNYYEEPEYYALSCHNKTFLFYWDDASNLAKPLSAEQAVLRGTKNAVLVGAAIENNGTIVRKVVSGATAPGGLDEFYKRECSQSAK